MISRNVCLTIRNWETEKIAWAFHDVIFDYILNIIVCHCFWYFIYQQWAHVCIPLNVMPFYILVYICLCCFLSAILVLASSSSFMAQVLPLGHSPCEWYFLMYFVPTLPPMYSWLWSIVFVHIWSGHCTGIICDLFSFPQCLNHCLSGGNNQHIFAQWMK